MIIGWETMNLDVHVLHASSFLIIRSINGPTPLGDEINKTGHRSVHIYRWVQAPNSHRDMGIGTILAPDRLLYLCPISPEAQKIKHV